MEGEGEGRVGAIGFYFPQPLALFGFSPHNFLIRAKMHKFRKVTKGGTHDHILTHPERGHDGGGPNGEVGVVVFLLGGWTLAQEEIEIQKEIQILQFFIRSPQKRTRS